MSPAATFVSQMSALRQGAPKTTEQAEPQVADPTSRDLQAALPGGSSADVATLKHQVASELAALAQVPGVAEAASPLEAVKQVLQNAQELLDQVDSAHGSNLSAVLSHGIVQRGASGTDTVAVADVTQAVSEALDLIASILALDLPRAPLAAVAKLQMSGETPMLPISPLVLRSVQAPTQTDQPVSRDQGLPQDPIFEQRTTIATPSTPSAPTNASDAQSLRSTVLQQIAEAGPKLLKHGGTTSLDLSPTGLGRLEVDVETNSSGALRIVLRAENPLVLDALRHDRSALADALTGHSSDGSFSFESFDGNSPEDRSAPGMTSPADATDVVKEAASHSPTTPMPAYAGALILDIIA